MLGGINGSYNYYMNNAYMPATNVQNNGMFGPNMNPYMNNGCSSQNSMNNMYPQVYRIINPVAQRVISNNSYPYYNEDNINNMVDTVYNIVEGDVNTLTSTSTTQVSGDDTMSQSQGTSRSASQNNNNTRQVTSETTRSTTSSMTVQTTNSNNQLLRDLIKIIILKELLSRQNNCGCNNNFNCGMNSMNAGTQNYYDPRCMGMI